MFNSKEPDANVGSHSVAFVNASSRSGGAPRPWWYRVAKLKPSLAGVGFSVVAFTVIELLHLVLVPEIGRQDERLLAAAVSAAVLGVIAAKLLAYAYKMRQMSVARLEIIAEMNHHIRNALQVIAYRCHLDMTQRDALNQVRDSVQRIDWALKEILPRLEPGMRLREEDKGPSSPDDLAIRELSQSRTAGRWHRNGN